MFYYLLLVPLSVGGVAMFLKGRRSWIRGIGFTLFGIALLGLLIVPIVLRQQ